MEIGESLVGAYMRHVRGCHTVACNAFLPDRQGEIDVIAIAGSGERQKVWLAEVAIHIDGLNYGDADTVEKVRQKVDRAVRYARDVYSASTPVVEFWSPRVPPKFTRELREHADFELVLNEDFTDRVNVLATLASKSSKQFGDDAFRFLQVLTHLRGARPTFVEAGPDTDAR
jgi:hypothetical protein